MKYIYFKKNIEILFFVLISSLSYASDKEIMYVGNLPRDMWQPIVLNLSIRSINQLRKTCGHFSQLLSFCEPSASFFLNNKNIHAKDMWGIFLNAIYHNKIEIVRSLADAYKDYNPLYRIPTGGVFFINDLTQNKEIRSLLTKPDLNGFYDHVKPSPLLMACISRNNKEVENILENELEIIQRVDFKESASIYTAIDNNDMPILSIMLSNKSFSSHMRTLGHCFIQRAFFNKNPHMCKMLIENKYCDENNKEKDCFAGWRAQTQDFQKIYTLKKIILNNSTHCNDKDASEEWKKYWKEYKEKIAYNNQMEDRYWQGAHMANALCFIQ